MSTWTRKLTSFHVMTNSKWFSTLMFWLCLTLLNWRWKMFVPRVSVFKSMGSSKIHMNTVNCSGDKRVPVTTAWRVIRLRMKERPTIWRVAANILNQQSRTADKGSSSSLGVGRGAKHSSPWKTKCYEMLMGEMLPLETKQSGGKILPHSDLQGGAFLGEASRNRSS